MRARLVLQIPTYHVNLVEKHCLLVRTRFDGLVKERKMLKQV